MANFTPVASLIGGILIGLASVWRLAASGRIAGISGILLFITGLIAAGFAWHFYPGAPPAREGFGLGWAAASGLLVGFGTRIGGGCTSGHGVCGLGRFSLRSLVAMIVFMGTGMPATYVMRHVL